MNMKRRGGCSLTVLCAGILTASLGSAGAAGGLANAPSGASVNVSVFVNSGLNNPRSGTIYPSPPE